MTSRYLKRLYEIAPYITELRGPNTPPRTGVVGVAAPARERRASDAQNRQIRRQRKTQGRFDPFTINQGTEIKMNRYMQTLIEKTRLQKEIEKRSKPQPAGFGRTATFQTTSGKKTFQDYEASRGRGAGSQAQALAADLEELPMGHKRWKQHDARVTAGEEGKKGKKIRLATKAQSVRSLRMDREPWRGAQPGGGPRKGHVTLRPRTVRPPEDVLSVGGPRGRTRDDKGRPRSLSPFEKKAGPRPGQLP